jgi:pimeloyl-ACP methyl ester carboxylesterase
MLTTPTGTEARSHHMRNDASSVLIDGPWEHRFVAANGARFHVAEIGEGPLVVLLHGFPQFWWAWRDQLTALAESGYRAAAIDLRGYGASDKPPRGYDTFTLAADVASIVRSLGESSAVIVGHGWGGWIAWSMPSMQPAVTTAVAALGMPHPLVLRHASWHNLAQIRANTYLAGLQRPFVPEHQMAKSPAYVEGLLGAWSAPNGQWPPPEVAQRYAQAMALPFVAHSAAEYYRWVVRSQWRLDGQRFSQRLRSLITVPVLQLQGEQDRAVVPALGPRSSMHVRGPFEQHFIPGAGHFLLEEAPAEVNEHLVRWLNGLALNGLP